MNTAIVKCENNIVVSLNFIMSNDNNNVNTFDISIIR